MSNEIKDIPKMGDKHNMDADAWRTFCNPTRNQRFEIPEEDRVEVVRVWMLLPHGGKKVYLSELTRDYREAGLLRASPSTIKSSIDRILTGEI